MDVRIVGLFRAIAVMMAFLSTGVASADESNRALTGDFHAVMEGLSKGSGQMITVSYPKYSYAATLLSQQGEPSKGVEVLKITYTRDLQPAIATAYHDLNGDGVVDGVTVVGSKVQNLAATPKDQGEFEEIIKLLAKDIKR